MEINLDRGKGACLSDGDLGVDRTIFVPGQSVQDSSPLAEQRGPYSQGSLSEEAIVKFDDDADTGSRGRCHGEATACRRRRVGESEYAETL